MKRLISALAGVAVLATVAAFVFGTLAEGGGNAQASHGATVIATASGDLVPTTEVVNTTLGINENTVEN